MATDFPHFSMHAKTATKVINKNNKHSLQRSNKVWRGREPMRLKLFLQRQDPILTFMAQDTVQLESASNKPHWKMKGRHRSHRQPPFIPHSLAESCRTVPAAYEWSEILYGNVIRVLNLASSKGWTT